MGRMLARNGTLGPPRPRRLLATATPPSRKGTPWLKVLKTLVAYRLLAPGSEWNLHRSWFDRSAMADLLDDNFRLAAKDTLYRSHDRLLEHREALFTHLRERWISVFPCSDSSPPSAATARTRCSSPVTLASASSSNRSLGNPSASISGAAPARCGSTTAPPTKSAAMQTASSAPRSPMPMATRMTGATQFPSSTDRPRPSERSRMRTMRSKPWPNGLR